MTSATSSPDRSAQTIATLREGELVEGVFACTRKQRALTRAGAPYLALELRDPSGALAGRAFREADVLGGRFERGELVRVRGRVARYREQLQIEVDEIETARGAEADPEAFLPVAYRDRDELEGFLEHLAGEVGDPALAGLLASLLGDGALREELRRAPCSIPVARAPGRPSSGHHAYLGGLLEHTVAVASMAVELCSVHQRLDRDLLLCAAIVHDVGKTREFVYGAGIERSGEGDLLGHVELGLRILAEHAPAALAGERRLALEHCVLLHHGPDRAVGRRFASAEALALHRLNALDAGIKACFEHGVAGVA